MSYKLYDYRDERGVNEVKEWGNSLQKRDRIRLNQKLDMLELYGSDLPPKLLSDTGAPEIKKLRITGRRIPTLRPMLCKGPIDNNIEFTILQGAIEKDCNLIPKDAVLLAKNKRQTIIECQFRRCEHERIN